MSEARRKKIIMVCLIPWPATYFLYMAALLFLYNDGHQFDWPFVVWTLFVGGIPVLLSVLMMGILMNSPAEDEEQQFQHSAIPAIEIVMPTQTRRPLLHRDEQRLLVGAVVAGVVGGLLAVLLFKRKGKNS